MPHSAERYEYLSDHCLNEAQRAATCDERVSYLRKAYEFAQMASAERKRLNVYEISAHTPRKYSSWGR